MSTPLQQAAPWILAAGIPGILAGAAMLHLPATVRPLLESFPRSKPAGWLLTAFAVAWVTWVVFNAPLGRFDALKPLVPVAGLALLAAMIFFLDELLAPRSLGGLLMLIANPVLMGIRWADSLWRYPVVLIAYAWVVAGCALMLHPWLFRRAARAILDHPNRWHRAAWSQLLIGTALLVGGVWCLR